MDLSNVLLVVSTLISVIQTAAADYCEWGYCSLSEYCCGYNECCSNVETTWILVCGLLTALVIMSVCFGCFYRHIDRYRMRGQWLFSPKDSLVSQENA